MVDYEYWGDIVLVWVLLWKIWVMRYSEVIFGVLYLFKLYNIRYLMVIYGSWVSCVFILIIWLRDGVLKF